MEVLPKTSLFAREDVVGLTRKRRRSIEPVDTPKILAMPMLSMSPRAMQDPEKPVKHDAFACEAAAPVKAPQPDELNEVEASECLRRSLMGLSLQLKLKMMLVEAWASDMNNVVIERNLFAIAKELAILCEMNVYEESTCVRFLELARERMVQLLQHSERKETLQMEAKPMWTMAQIQAKENMFKRDSVSTTEFPLLTGYDASSRDISVLWKAMSIARERGAQLWHENKPEQALPFLLAADSYMKRFTLKYQRLKIDHAMVDSMSTCPPNPMSPVKTKSSRHVSFRDEPVVIGTADADVDRSPICPTKPSKLESLLLRTSREFPTPGF
ncbi:TPA: hypothetical protein N0F65_009688 [Lagenidium giganteum]|uniref:Uncharacterized protein n=1 Tax=Lagenidium giganteum TaxID=4803 RepID=A0AAV2YRR6_9STRA|nr:TPA: hypothetical protein N0F65_009688 [Lagenidium giganteum]